MSKIYQGYNIQILLSTILVFIFLWFFSSYQRVGFLSQSVNLQWHTLEKEYLQEVIRIEQTLPNPVTKDGIDISDQKEELKKNLLQLSENKERSGKLQSIQQAIKLLSTLPPKPISTNGASAGLEVQMQRYQTQVSDFNKYLESMPYSLIAGLFTYEKIDNTF
jgi:hypothetical protein